MPFPRTRHALTTVALVVLVALAAIGSIAPARAQAPTGNIIADTALKYLGTYQGDCWPFVRKVLLEAGYDLGFDYIDGFLEKGAIEIRPEEARAGDIIQIIDDDDHGPNADYPGMHTAIVLENYGNRTYRVIDSNANWDGIVRIRDYPYDPFAAAARYGLDVHFFRYPDVKSSPRPSPTAAPSEPTDPADWAPGVTAMVVTGEDVLNVRSSPQIANNVIGQFKHGTRLTVLSAPTSGSGLLWVRVRAENGLEGWVAAQYLAKVQNDPPASGGGGGAPKELPHHIFVPGIAADR